jgi:hypothetical protein
MSWWLAIALVYLALCWVGWIVSFRLTWAEEENSDDRFIGFLFRQRPEIYWLSLSLLLVVIGPFFPLAMAYGLWMGWKERRAWRKFKRTHRKMLLEPMHPANFPRAAQEHIEWCSPVLLRLGFAPAGTYLLKPEPFPIYSQCLLSRAGETSGDVSLIDEMPSVSFVSVLENGHVLETGCCTATLPAKHLAAIERSGRFTVQMFQPQEDEEFLAEVYHRHRALLAELEQRLGCGTLHLPLDQVPGIKHYENGVYGEVLFALGKKDNRPQPPQCPTGPAKRISLVH